MEDKGNRVRMHIAVAPEVKKYIDDQAKSYGMNVSAYITMVVQQYKQQSSVIELMPQMLKTLSEQKSSK